MTSGLEGVRGLVGKWRESAARLERGFGPGDTLVAIGKHMCADELESALPTPPADAEQRAVDASDAALQCFNAALTPSLRVPNTLAYKLAMAEAIVAALTQQPEARGVVDEAMVERAMDADAEEYGASIPASRVRRLLIAALTEARNVR